MTVGRVFKNIRVYYLAFIAYWGIVLFGYDTGIAGGVVSQTYFEQEFGLLNPDGSKNTARTNDVSSNVVSVLQAGAFFGALGSAPISSRLGRKWTLIAFTSVFSIGAILATVAKDKHHGLQLIYAGRVISGLGIGGISAVAPAYVSECSPKEVRGRITGLFQIMVAIGVMLSYFINYGIGINMPSGPNVWRIPFGFQLVPAGIMLLGLFTVK
ncbi:Quinate permease, partial [Termitomyces sp. T112]